MKVVSIPAALGRVRVGIAFYGRCLFLAPGTIEWPQGWLLLVILAYAAIGEDDEQKPALRPIDRSWREEEAQSVEGDPDDDASECGRYGNNFHAAPTMGRGAKVVSVGGRAGEAGRVARGE